MCAYETEQFAATLAEFGRPRFLPHSGGWVLERQIAGFDDVDAMGPYPLFACRDWSALPEDLAELGDLVSLVLVADPFGGYDPTQLATWFNRGATPFKQHHVVELGSPVDSLASPHHRRNARKALRAMDVSRVENPLDLLNDWQDLYDVLIERHAIRGLARFSLASFTGLLALSGLVAYRAEAEGRTIGMLLWLVRDNVAYYHLGAYSPTGYALNASFALFWKAIEDLADRVKWLDLGAGAGVGDGSGGLDRFKAGWATATRTAYLCRHVSQPDRYEVIAQERGLTGSSFFPAYRAEELLATATEPAPRIVSHG